MPEPKAKRYFRFDDIGNAGRLIHLHGLNLRYVDKWGKWIVWYGNRWHEDSKSVRVTSLAKGISQSLYRELTGDEERHKAKRRWAVESASRRRIDAAVYLARSEALISHDELDADPDALGLANGWIDLRTGEFRPPDRNKLMTLRSPVRWNPDALCPRFNEAMQEWFPNVQTRSYVHRVVGKTALGSSQDDNVMIINIGDGANGKSTLARILSYIFGDYAVPIDVKLITETRYPAHDSATAVLFRRRLAIASETSRRVRLNEASVKNLTGGDEIVARRLYEDQWRFRPTHTLWLMTNHLPEIAGRDHGIWRRIRALPWVAHFNRTKDSNLDNQLKREAAGILRWIVRGAQDYLANGLDEPEEVLAATKDYRHKEDIIARWREECGYVFDRALSTPASQLVESWTKWTELVLDRPRRFLEVATFLEESGCTRFRKGENKLLHWLGIGKTK